MNLRQNQLLSLTVILILSACAKQAQAVLPTATLPPPTETSAPPTEIPIPSPTQDPTLFGAIGTGEIQGFVVESFANAIFTKTMDALKTSGAIQDYQTLRVTVFPGEMSLLAEVTFNVQTTDPAWLADGGTPAADNWINEKCYRFNFMANEAEYQLRNKRLCN